MVQATYILIAIAGLALAVGIIVLIIWAATRSNTTPAGGKQVKAGEPVYETELDVIKRPDPPSVIDVPTNIPVNGEANDAAGSLGKTDYAKQTEGMIFKFTGDDPKHIYKVAGGQKRICVAVGCARDSALVTEVDRTTDLGKYLENLPTGPIMWPKFNLLNRSIQ